MTAFVALLRGINVGGKHSLPMQALRDILGSLACDNVKTYIQSGNAVLTSASSGAALGEAITAAIEREFSFAPSVHILEFEDYQAILAANPFPDAVDEPKSLHIAFLRETPNIPDIQKINELKSSTEQYELCDGAFFLHAPDGIGRSKLAGRLDKCLGVETTGRNWRTASKIAELAESIIS